MKSPSPACRIAPGFAGFSDAADQGENLLDGGRGADVIFGGVNRDTIFGGPGGRSEYRDVPSDVGRDERRWTCVNKYVLRDYDLIYTGIEAVPGIDVAAGEYGGIRRRRGRRPGGRSSLQPLASWERRWAGPAPI